LAVVKVIGAFSIERITKANTTHVAGTLQTAGDINGALLDGTTGLSAAHVERAANDRNIRQIVESQRGHHTACGAVFYVKKGGSDANPGTYALPFLTIQAALNACTANAHDTVIVLGVTGSSPSTFTEAVTMSKAYTFLRGMGRDTKITTAGAASSTVTISANGCEVSGLWINNTGSGATKGIELASGSDFALLHHLSVDGAATGINATAGTNTIIEDNWINDCATTGINMAQGGSVGLHASILRNHIDGSAIGINFAGNDSTESVARYNNIAGCTTGVIIAAGAVRIQVTDNRFAGNTTNWTDAGTNTNLSWNSLSTSIAGDITTVTNLTNAPTNGDLTATMKASVNSEVVDTLATDTYAEPGQGTPAATASLSTKIGYLMKAWRNKKTQTAAQFSLLNDDAVTVDQKAVVSDDGTTTAVGEIATGP
jgi:hypothetical protein